MTIRTWRPNTRFVRLLPAAAIAAAAVWFGGSLQAQPDAGGEDIADMRAHNRAMRATALGGGAAASSSNTGQVTTVFGIATDFFVPADYDSDGKADHAVWHGLSATAGEFRILRSVNSVEVVIPIGQIGDQPEVVGDYDGDGTIDVAVYRSGATAGAFSSWIYHPSSGGADVTITCTAVMDCGKNGSFAAPGDYNGDGKNDFAVQRNHASTYPATPCAPDPSQGTLVSSTPTADFFIVLNGSSTHMIITCVGQATDIVVPGDYDGDGTTDIAIVRGVSGQIEWTVRRSSTLTFSVTRLGLSSSDFPTQGDYDNDGKVDLAVWRPSATPGLSAFLIRPSSGGPIYTHAFGQNGDYPVANAFTF